MKLIDFVRKSNLIEGIRREPTTGEVAAHREFLEDKVLDVGLFVQFVNIIQPGALIRDNVCMDVRVGDHTPMLGGPMVLKGLESIINRVNDLQNDVDYQIDKPRQPNHAYLVHREYEDLHPFMDGNGRSGRVLWLRMMGGIERVPLGFLHHWYYQSLQAARQGGQ